jgi:hypothetical protein
VVPVVKHLLSKGLTVDDETEDGLTPLMVAARSGQLDTANLILAHGADVTQRDPAGRVVIKLALDAGHTALAHVIVDRCPALIVTDPRLPKGEAWLRRQFAVTSNNVADAASKPDPALLERLVLGRLGPIAGRGVGDVYWEHIFLRHIGDLPRDIRRNYSPQLVLALVGTFECTLHGHDGKPVLVALLC